MLFRSNPEHAIPQNKKQVTILLLCGIANPLPLEAQLKLEYKEVIPSYFSDHYDFKEEDLKEVSLAFDKIAGTSKVIITTEKDWMRLQKSELQEWVKKLPLFYIPIKTDFNEKDKQEFNTQIINYVRTN